MCCLSAMLGLDPNDQQFDVFHVPLALAGPVEDIRKSAS